MGQAEQLENDFEDALSHILKTYDNASEASEALKPHVSRQTIYRLFQDPKANTRVSQSVKKRIVSAIKPLKGDNAKDVLAAAFNSNFDNGALNSYVGEYLTISPSLHVGDNYTLGELSLVQDGDLFRFSHTTETLSGRTRCWRGIAVGTNGAINLIGNEDNQMHMMTIMPSLDVDYVVSHGIQLTNDPGVGGPLAKKFAIIRNSENDREAKIEKLREHIERLLSNDKTSHPAAGYLIS